MPLNPCGSFAPRWEVRFACSAESGTNKRGTMAATSSLHELKSLTTKQRSAVIAAFLGWALDAFDFFIVVFVLSNIAHDFNTTVKNVAYGITLTLMMRPVGA